MALPPTTIAVLGAGNLGLAQAGHLASLGHRVRLWNRSPLRLGPLADGLPLQLRGVLGETVALERASTDLAAAVKGADLIFVDLPANAHAEVARALGGVLTPETSPLVVLHPGQSFGARHFARALGMQRFPRLRLAELQTALYTARSAGLAEATVLAIKRRVAFASYPANHPSASEDRVTLQNLYPQLFLAPSTLHTGLMNVQSFIHPGVVLSNLTRIDAAETFKIYRQGLSPAVGQVMNSCDAERLALARQIGLDVPSAAQWFGLGYGVVTDTALEAMGLIKAYDDLLAPPSLRTRLLWEDVPTGLLPLVELSRALRIPAPTMEGLLATARAVCGPELTASGWTLDRLGLNGNVQALSEAF